MYERTSEKTILKERKVQTFLSSQKGENKSKHEKGGTTVFSISQIAAKYKLRKREKRLVYNKIRRNKIETSFGVQRVDFSTTNSLKVKFWNQHQ